MSSKPPAFCEVISLPNSKETKINIYQHHAQWNGENRIANLLSFWLVLCKLGRRGVGKAKLHTSRFYFVTKYTSHSLVPGLCPAFCMASDEKPGTVWKQVLCEHSLILFRAPGNKANVNSISLIPKLFHNTSNKMLGRDLGTNISLHRIYWSLPGMTDCYYMTYSSLQLWYLLLQLFVLLPEFLHFPPQSFGINALRRTTMEVVLHKPGHTLRNALMGAGLAAKLAPKMHIIGYLVAMQQTFLELISLIQMLLWQDKNSCNLVARIL